MTQEAFKNSMEYWENNYSIIGDFDFLEKQTLGIKNRYCRFCGKSYPSAKFKDVAHAIPESLGNKFIISNYECDSCNHYFGEHLEDHLNKYMLPYRMASQIFGKKNKIEYRTDEMNKITVTPGNWKAFTNENDITFKIVDDHTIEFNFIRQTYKPILVYKALVKIGLTLVPESELINLEKTIFWLKAETPAPEDGIGKYVMMRFFPGPNSFPFSKITLFKRKNDILEVPMYQMFIAIKNYYFQIAIPCYEKDKQLQNKNIRFIAFPTPLDFNNDIKTGSGIIDLSSWEAKKNENVPIQMHYEKSEVREDTGGDGA